MYFKALLVASTLAVAAPVLADGDIAAGRTKSETCLGCHGVAYYVNTYPTYHVPLIGGQHADYLASALKAYRDGTRAHETMQANAGSLTDEDIADISAYFASLQ